MNQRILQLLNWDIGNEYTIGGCGFNDCASVFEKCKKNKGGMSNGIDN